MSTGRKTEYDFRGEGWSVHIEAETPDLAKDRIIRIADAWRPAPRRSLARWIYDVFFAWGGER